MAGMTVSEHFFETDVGQLAAGAHMYLTAARLLRESETWETRPTVLQRPTLHLLAHGIELLLKFPLVAGGMRADDVRKTFGHDLGKLWSRDENEQVRARVLVSAEEAWNAAAASGRWSDEDFSKDPKDEVVKALDKLSWLHSRESGFPLRYIAAPNTPAPTPAFVLDAFGPVAEEAVKNPRILCGEAAF